jgi:Circularly permutated YpsA SLOG family
VVLKRIVSGGQTGADRAGLDVAMELGIPCGGWCPKGRRSEDGVIPEQYPLQETASKDYRKRTEMNVIDSDGTLILAEGKLSGGTALTADMTRRNGKPLLVADLQHPPSPDEVAKWIHDNRIEILNVAGPRESECPGIYQKGKGMLLRVLNRQRLC